MINLLGFSAAFLSCLIIRILFFKKENTPTASGAIVMAIGIFLYSAMQQFSIYVYGEVFAFILASVWLLIVVSILSTLRDKTFREKHLHDPIALFAIGTWVAGTSVLGNVIHQFSLNLGIFPYIMGVLNIVLYLWYLNHVFPAFFKIVRSELKDKVHGVLLLTTVSTQSIVLLLFNIFQDSLPDWGNSALIAFGIAWYGAGFYLIMRRYLMQESWNIADDWKNTNCIVHGAVSITGLAAVTTGTFSYTFQLVLWIWVIIFFIIVEGIEIFRAVVRSKKYGLIRGVFTYDVSQWSRNFTFGMLYAFTARFQMNADSIFSSLREIILSVWPWFVLMFLIIEIGLFIRTKLKPEVIWR